MSIKKTTMEILQSKLLIISSNAESFANTMSKQELADICEELGAEIRKSWKKQKLIQVLFDKTPDYINKLLEDRQVVEINPIFYNDLNAFKSYSEELSNVFKVLCF